MDISTLQFLRPWWFLGLLPVAVFLLLSLRRSQAASPWQKSCDEHLLEHLWVTPPGGLSHRFLLLLGIGWLVTIISLAGPVWERQPQPVYRADLSRVVLLDLSDSMNAVDIAPSRLQRARFKLSDILKRSGEGRTALIVFAGEAHIVTPLTSDTQTIETMIPALATDIVPARGSLAMPALNLAQSLLKRAKARIGQVVLVTDGVDDMAGSLKAVRALKQLGFPVSVLGVGTIPGAPTPNADGSFGKMARLVPAELIELANAGGGVYSQMTANAEDLNVVLSDIDDEALADKVESEAQVERWVEYGFWLLPLVLFLAATGMRKGWLGVVLVAGLLPMLMPTQSLAGGWSDLWMRSDQQGLRALKQQQPERAAALFENTAWRGTALYSAGQFDQAAAAFAEVDGADADYNRGNALARAGHLEKAKVAFEEALKAEPSHSDAAANLKLVEDLLKKDPPPGQPPQQQPPPPLPKQDDNNNQQPPPEEQQGDGEQQDSSDPERERKDEKDQDSPEKHDADAARRDAEQQMKKNQQDNPENKPPQQPETGSQSPSPSVAHNAALPNDEPVHDPNLDQWLRQVPDDPSGLLRRKFMLEHLRRKEGESSQ